VSTNNGNFLPQAYVHGLCRINIGISPITKNVGTSLIPSAPFTIRFLGGHKEECCRRVLKLRMTSEGLGKMFEGDFTDMCAEFSPHLSQLGDPHVCSSFTFLLIRLFLSCIPKFSFLGCL
jgi:hypothetical protein